MRSRLALYSLLSSSCATRILIKMLVSKLLRVSQQYSVGLVCSESYCIFSLLLFGQFSRIQRCIRFAYSNHSVIKT